MKKSKPFEIDWSHEGDFIDLKKHGRHHFWRGFMSALSLITTIILVIVIVSFIYNWPDYTMTPSQYQEYIYSCSSQ